MTTWIPLLWDSSSPSALEELTTLLGPDELLCGVAGGLGEPNKLLGAGLQGETKPKF